MVRHRLPRLSGAMRWKTSLAALAAAVGCGLAAEAQDVRVSEPAAPCCASPAQPAPLKLGLDEAIAMALERQPTIAAARAGLNSSHAAREVAYSPFSFLGGPSIKFRRRQADLGVSIAEANVLQVRLETANAVTRSYVSVLFAREQLDLATRAVERIRATRKAAESLVQSGSKEVTKADLDRLDTFLKLGEGRIGEAKIGELRAKAALREAIGLGQQVDLEVGSEKLSNLYDAFIEHEKKNNVSLSCRLAVRTALDKRPELIQASLLSQIHCLEVDAQAADNCCNIYGKTFAATSDIHSRILPATVINGEYRPGPVGPEMPVYLAGMPEARAQRARFLYERSLAVADKAANLVALETEEACARLKGQVDQIKVLLEATANSKKLADDGMRIYVQDQMSTEKLLTIQLLDAQASSTLNEAYFKFGQAIGLLQRATAGEFWTCFEAVPAPQPKAEEKK